MTLCPIAIAVGCKKCPMFKICPAKSILGDYKGDNAKEEKNTNNNSAKDKKKQ